MYTIIQLLSFIVISSLSSYFYLRSYAYIYEKYCSKHIKYNFLYAKAILMLLHIVKILMVLLYSMLSACNLPIPLIKLTVSVLTTLINNPVKRVAYYVFICESFPNVIKKRLEFSKFSFVIKLMKLLMCKYVSSLIVLSNNLTVCSIKYAIILTIVSYPFDFIYNHYSFNKNLTIKQLINSIIYDMVHFDKILCSTTVYYWIKFMVTNSFVY